MHHDIQVRSGCPVDQDQNSSKAVSFFFCFITFSYKVDFVVRSHIACVRLFKIFVVVVDKCENGDEFIFER